MGPPDDDGRQSNGGSKIAGQLVMPRGDSAEIFEPAEHTLDKNIRAGECVRGHSHVRRFKQQAACPSSCSAWPPLGKAGGTIMKRRLIML
jgi:hypothetical protein